MAARQRRLTEVGQLCERVRELEQRNAELEALLYLERRARDRDLERMRAADEREREKRLARDRNRKKGLAPEPRPRGPRWSASDEEQFREFLLPYEQLCSAAARRRGVDEGALSGRERYIACCEVARATRRSYSAVRSILSKMWLKKATWVPTPPSGSGRSSE